MDFSEPGFVAMLQLYVAMRAKIIILAGGGSFQSIAERATHHQQYSDARVHHVNDC